MCYAEETITSRDGLRLRIRRSEAVRPRAEAILVHGFGEHCGRYGPLTEHLVSHGYSVTAYDQRGHGLSQGLPGHVERFTDYEDDLDRIVTAVRSRSNARPLFIAGHSMGGLIALRYLARSPADFAGAVLSAPLLGVAVKVPAVKLLIAKAGSRIAPRFRLDNGIDPSFLSRDPEVGRAYAADPLVNRLVSTRWFAEATRAMHEAMTLASRISTPVLLMHGSEDRLASVDAAKDYFAQIGAGDKELRVFPGFYHELFNEPEKNEVFELVTGWLDRRCELKALAAR